MFFTSLTRCLMNLNLVLRLTDSTRQMNWYCALVWENHLVVAPSQPSGERSDLGQQQASPKSGPPPDLGSKRVRAHRAPRPSTAIFDSNGTIRTDLWELHCPRVSRDQVALGLVGSTSDHPLLTPRVCPFPAVETTSPIALGHSKD